VVFVHTFAMPIELDLGPAEIAVKKVGEALAPRRDVELGWPMFSVKWRVFLKAVVDGGSYMVEVNCRVRGKTREKIYLASDVIGEVEECCFGQCLTRLLLRMEVFADGVLNHYSMDCGQIWVIFCDGWIKGLMDWITLVVAV
jgi:hypothetical protein